MPPRPPFALLHSPPPPSSPLLPYSRSRFQPVMVGEPTLPEAEAILEGLRERYERHHRCVYSSEAVRAAVALSARYVADRFLPDKVGS